MELISVILVGFVAILAFIVMTSRRSGSIIKVNSRKTIPGPKPVDKRQGNFPEIIQAGSLHHFLCDMHTKYGDVIQIWFGDKPTISTASPRAFTDQMKLFDKPGMTFIEPVFGNRGIQFVNGDEAKQRRRNYDVFLNQDSVHQYFHMFKEVVDLYVTRLSKLPVDSSVNVYDVMFDLSCKAVGVTLFGDYFKNDDNVQSFKKLYTKFNVACLGSNLEGVRDLQDSNHHMQIYSSYDFAIAFFARFWPVLEKNFTNGLPVEGTEERQYFDQVVEQVHNVARDLIASRQNRTDRKFIDVVIETGHDEITILGDILVYLVGGFHSTSITLTWCVYHASKYPETRARIHDELSRVLEHSDVTPSAILEMRYLRCFINETLRLRFVAPVATRKAGQNTVIGGYELPAHIDIIQALSVVLTSESEWENPDRFNPERFIISRTKSRLHSEKRSPLAFCPFGFAGRRKCPGQKFFFEEAMVFLSTLFRHFEFHVTNDDVKITYGLLTRPEDDIFATIKRRHSE